MNHWFVAGSATVCVCYSLGNSSLIFKHYFVRKILTLFNKSNYLYIRA